MKTRFVTLDAMRGVAALAVVWSHSRPMFGGLELPFANLAVDFFFCLSGFVLGYAYDERFERGLGAFQFMRMRALRLYPLFGLGLAIGVAVAAVAGTPSPNLLNAAMLPAGPGTVLFPGDGPAWSLFYEFWVANLLWALCWRQIRGRILQAILAASGVAMVLIALKLRTYDVGWHWSQLALGVYRVAFSFFLGVWLARRHKAAAPRFILPPWVSLLLLAAVLGAHVPAVLVPVYLVAAVFVVIPALVFYSARAVEGAPSLLSALGDASYATYATHWAPLVLVSWLIDHQRPGTVATVAAVLFSGAAGLALDRLYDRPLRGWLNAFRRRERLANT